MKHSNLLFVFIIATFLVISGCASQTPLIKASTSGDSAVVQRLINEGANINEPDSKGNSPLMHAIWSRNAETVKVLIDKGADVNAGDKYNTTPLMNAISSDYIEIVKLLIDKGADVNVQDKTGLTALHHVAHSYNYNNASMLTEYLLNNNASINIKDANGRTALRYAILYRNIDVVATIRKKTNCVEEIESLTMGEALKNTSSYKPEQDMFHVPVGREQAFKIAVTDCNLMVIPDKGMLVLGTGPFGYAAGLAIDAVTVPKKFQSCMAKMGFEYKKNGSSNAKNSNQKVEEPIAPKQAIVDNKHNAQITNPPIPAPSEYAEKLRELKKLRDEGLLNDEEYEIKRKAIVDGI